MNTTTPTKPRRIPVREKRKQLEESQLIVEHSLLKSLRLDHLDGVDRVYGIKRRPVTYPARIAA